MSHPWHKSAGPRPQTLLAPVETHGSPPRTGLAPDQEIRTEWNALGSRLIRGERYQVTVTVFEQAVADPASHTWYVAMPPPFPPVESV
jgi:hypothetical protein